MNAITVNPGPAVSPSASSTSASKSSVDSPRPNDVRGEPASREAEFGPTLDKAQQALERHPDAAASSPGEQAARTQRQTETASSPVAAERTTESALATKAKVHGLDTDHEVETTELPAPVSDAESDNTDHRIQAAIVGASLPAASASPASAEPADNHNIEASTGHMEPEPDSEAASTDGASTDGATADGTQPAQTGDSPAIAGDTPTGAYGDHAGVANLAYRNLQHATDPEATVAEATSSPASSPDQQGSDGVATAADPISALSATINEESITSQDPAVASPGATADNPQTAPGRTVTTTTASVEDQASESSAESPSATKSSSDPVIISDRGGHDVASVVTREAAVRAVESLSSPDQLTADPPLDEAAETQLWSQVQRAFSRVRTNLDGQELRIRLRPAELGELLVQVQTLGEQLSVRLVASSAAAQQTLLNDRQRLAAELAEAGFDEGFVDITRDDGPADNRQANTRHGSSAEADGRPAGDRTRSRSDDAITLTGERRPNSDRHPHLALSRPRAGSTVSLTL